MGKKGKKPSGKWKGARDEHTQMADSSPCHWHPKILRVWAQRLWINLVFVTGWGEGQVTGKVTKTRKETMLYLDLVREERKNSATFMLDSFLMKKVLIEYFFFQLNG